MATVSRRFDSSGSVRHCLEEESESLARLPEQGGQVRAI